MTAPAFRPIRRLLVANRGEIAVRVMKTARAMGIETVAVFSDADVDALHVATADLAVRLGPAPARESYLDAAKILEAARATRADAIHPGYGFLSENADFAEAIEEAGLIFVGPPASAIRAMGSKAAAKALMETAHVPLVPGHHGEDQSEATLRAAAERIGFPVLIKASAGGGGKGMKVVERAEDLAEILASARREAKAAFGDDRVLIEKYLARPRHVEVQVFADALGNTIHLFERDCSLQRRHQKVIEEAPAPGISPERRAAMGSAAVDAARAVGYVGAGTVEFIVEGDQFFFMEMNTRLQVEHPVTEAITGLDLVEWQIRVARGEPLPLGQDEIRLSGHAVEARLYAEDPARDFLPQTGRLARLAFPDGVRIDAGVREGDEISRHYDPMIAKLIAHGATRDEALDRLAAALRATELDGPATNLGFLERLVDHPGFRADAHDTGFIAREAASLLPDPPIDQRLAVAAALIRLASEMRDAPRAAADPFSPFASAGPFALNAAARRIIVLHDGAAEREVVFETRRGETRVLVDGSATPVACALDGDAARVRVGDARFAVRFSLDGDRIALASPLGRARLTEIDPREGAAHHHHHADRLTAPMPGSVVQVLVEAGATVEAGAALVVVEAMKMEHVVRAPHDGVVETIRVAVGDVVAEGYELAVMAAEA
ncbi:MAG: acetyl/propionyl/methylcrotonyl-CoA carboxylase subunit alpha [Hyphomicrobiales bacterium]|nr:acetyl/propionyl/methylcrotonyl-CoA carboxylase subunit alpha [Hyphomicrobiales bacterium]